MHPNEQKLQAWQNRVKEPVVTKINDRVYHFFGFGPADAIAIIGDTSVILVDALNSVNDARLLKAALEAITDKPVHTIIYTHSHGDHTRGAGAFRDTVKEVIALAPQKPVLKHYDMLRYILHERAKLQFGFGLSSDETFSNALGTPKEFDPLEPTTVLDAPRTECVIDGVKMEILAAVGETDDTLYVWLPEERVVCVGDNYYGCWPNLYAPRGSQYRDIAAWVDSLTLALDLKPLVLLPGHSAPLVGEDVIQDVIGTLRDAIDYILINTLECMNKGMTPSEIVEAVQLPEEYASKPFLGEYYGTVEWAVRSIYGAYLGWFDGNGVNLKPVSDATWDATLVELIGEEKLVAKIESCLAKEEYQLAAQLADLAGRKDLVQKALRGRAHEMTSSNARHYLFTYANSLE